MKSETHYDRKEFLIQELKDEKELYDFIETAKKDPIGDFYLEIGGVRNYLSTADFSCTDILRKALDEISKNLISSITEHNMELEKFKKSNN